MLKVYKYLALILLVASTTLFAQKYTISGVVKDAATGEKLIGANVYVKGTTFGAASDANGRYKITLNKGKYTVVCSYVGFQTQEVNVNLTNDITLDFDMVEREFSLSVTVLADRARERETPVAFSNIEKKEMEQVLASRDIPLVLNSTPSVYATQQGGGAGDARINVRGFNQRNVAIMINGVPVNDMENGWVYWSNWDGVSDATASIQMQRGLSAVNLATPSIGGTMNIITDPAAQDGGIYFKQEYATGSFSKSSFFFNSGLVDNKWAVSGGIVRKTGDGIVNGTWTDAWAYYLGAAYNVNDKNRIELYALGAPQRHGNNYYQQNIAVYNTEFAKNLDSYDQEALKKYHEAGRLFNQNWSGVSPSYRAKQWLGDEIGDRYARNFINERENFFHKPQVNLNWYSNLSEKLSLFSTIYYSGGHGGGTGPYGKIRRNSWEGPFDNEHGKFYYFGAPWTYNWDETIAINQADSGTYFIDKKPITKDDHQSVGIIRNSRNNQWTIGAIAKALYKLNKNINLTFGIDWRTAEIDHFKEVRDLLGGTYYVDYSSEFWGPEGKAVKLGDKIDYNFTNNVNWLGGFTQFEYTSPLWSTYVTAGYSMIKYKHTNYFKKDIATGKTLVIEADPNTGFQLKGGLSHRFSNNFNVYVNGGYIAKVPIFDAVINDRTGQLIENPQTENFISGELGLNYNSQNREFNTNINLYYTLWQNRVVTVNDFDQLSGTEGLFVISDMDQLHAGIELDFAWQPTKLFRLDGAASVGNWKNTNDAKFTYKDYEQSTADSVGVVYTDGLKVGDAPQTQLALAASLFPTKGLSVMLSYRYYADFYANWNVSTRLDPNDRTQSWKTPAYGVMDLHINYTLPLNLPGVERIKLFAHAFNLLNTLYIQDATDNSKYNGFDKDHDADDASVFFGLPRYFNVGFSINLL